MLQSVAVSPLHSCRFDRVRSTSCACTRPRMRAHTKQGIKYNNPFLPLQNRSLSFTFFSLYRDIKSLISFLLPSPSSYPTISIGLSTCSFSHSILDEIRTRVAGKCFRTMAPVIYGLRCPENGTQVSTGRPSVDYSGRRRFYPG